MKIPTPPGIRAECLRDENLYRRYGNVVSAYDPKSSIGGMYHLDEKQWLIFFPITPDEFASRVSTAVASFMDKPVDRKAFKPVVVN